MVARPSYQQVCRLAEAGEIDQARSLYATLEGRIKDRRIKALVRNDLAALAAVEGGEAAAIEGFRAALEIDEHCEPARRNLVLLETVAGSARTEVPIGHGAAPLRTEPDERIKVALVSFLFNWPSTGGGIVHTFELAQFLQRAGYRVQHYFATYEPWQVGCVQGGLPHAHVALAFDDSTWNIPNIQASFQRAVREFDPDYVIITDSWNIKPHLAEALQEYPYILRMQAMECLCPLNGVRLLPEPEGRVRQCPLQQLANPNECRRCLNERGHLSGGLHQAERALSGVEKPEYHDRLLRAFRDAEAVLVVNPLHEAMLSPYARSVRVVTSGMDPARFPWPWPNEDAVCSSRQIIFFAGLVEEWMKGFHVLHEACGLLWERRRDFELVATADPSGQVDAFTRFVGWQSQENLPGHLRAASMVVMPTIAQEALGRTAVEAMAVGCPVIASRLGGLPFTITDGATGLLFDPGDSHELACKIETLLDDADLRTRLGNAGRRRFEEHYSWDVIIAKHYKPLLNRRRSAAVR
jgi:glycosyltransferase involved in cell wall biosynthesis